MKGKLLFLLVLILLFAGFVFVRFFFLDAQNAFGKLKVISSPSATVFINNIAIGKTPYEDKYKVGEYLIKLIPEETATETASWNGKVKIYKNAMSYVERDLGSTDLTSSGSVFTTAKMDMAPKNGGYGEIYVETEPQGAIITLDNDEKGVAPLVMQDVLRGDHEISVIMPGFFRQTKKINVDPGYRVNAAFKLGIDQSSPLQAATGSKPKTATDSAELEGEYVTINDNPQGWLRVRADASVEATEEAKIKTGQRYQLIEEKTDWYKIKYNDNSDGLESGSFTEGWISAQYSTKE